MITEIRYHNFRILADTVLKLSPCTLIVGPNGSGKSTAIRGIGVFPNALRTSFASVASIDVRSDASAFVELAAKFDDGSTSRARWVNDQKKQNIYVNERQRTLQASPERAINSMVFFLDPAAIAAPCQILPSTSLAANGSGLAGVLQEIRDQHPERFDDLVGELRRWLPDFDALLFQTPTNGWKSVALRTQIGRHLIPATDLSEGTLLALALLTMAYLPNPPEIIAVEEPDRGIHPRLLREVRDALYRLAYPESFGESRKPVQVIAATHSPYLVDLFKDHPEEVVLAQKKGLHATLDRLTDQPDWEEILLDAQLGDLWYSGVLGGVPAGS